MANKLILHTDRISQGQQSQVNQLLSKIVPLDTEVTQYNHNIEIPWQNIPPIPMDIVNKYDSCITIDDFNTTATNWKSDSYECPGIDDWWKSRYPDVADTLYHWGSGHLYGYTWSNARLHNFNFTSAPTDQNIWLYAPNLTGAFIFGHWSRWVYYYMPNVTEIRLSYAVMFDGYIPKVTKFNMGEPQQIAKGFYAELPSLSEGYFAGGKQMIQFNKDSALRILNSIPAWNDGLTHSLSIGIHTDYQTDTEVLAAIAKVQTPVKDGGKGWALAVQWNGNSSAKTNNTNTQVIYARVRDYETAEGIITQKLDWAHYVSNPANYKEFNSIDEAMEYFGLTEDEAI